MKDIIQALEVQNDRLESKLAKLQNDVIRLRCTHKDDLYAKQKELEELRKENNKLKKNSHHHHHHHHRDGGATGGHPQHQVDRPVKETVGQT